MRVNKIVFFRLTVVIWTHIKIETGIAYNNLYYIVYIQIKSVQLEWNGDL
jgi:hypothetical protein